MKAEHILGFVKKFHTIRKLDQYEQMPSLNCGAENCNVGPIKYPSLHQNWQAPKGVRTFPGTVKPSFSLYDEVYEM